MVNTQDLPDFNDEYLGWAILALMGFVMYAWITSTSSPLPNFAYKSNLSAMIGHFEIFLFVVIPFALMGLIKSMNPESSAGKASNRASNAAMRLALRSSAYKAKRKAERSQRRKEVIITPRRQTAIQQEIFYNKGRKKAKEIAENQNGYKQADSALGE